MRHTYTFTHTHTKNYSVKENFFVIMRAAVGAFHFINHGGHTAPPILFFQEKLLEENTMDKTWKNNPWPPASDYAQHQKPREAN